MFCNPLFSNHILSGTLRGEKINATDNVHNENNRNHATKLLILNTEPLLCLPCLKQCYSIVSRWIIHTCNIYSKTACILVSVEVCGCVRDGYRSLFQHQCSVGISRRDLKSLDPCTVVAHTGSVVCDDSVSPKIHIPWAARYNRGSSIFKTKNLITIRENTINLYNIL